MNQDSNYGWEISLRLVSRFALNKIISIGGNL